LVSFPAIPFDEYPQKHKEYIALGERMEQNKGYKCGIRDRWYIVPSVWVPDAFFLRRNNLYPKFVLNRCGAVSTDTMHRMKFRDGVDAKNILLSYYNSVSFAFAEICGRSYGGGVLEILPGEMGNILVPIVDGIDIALRDDLLEKIEEIIRRDDDVELVLNLVDDQLLVRALGIEAEICQQCRNIWKKLQQRRLCRSKTDVLQ
jgi:adenine-specific DNA-methyltransferase